MAVTIEETGSKKYATQWSFSLLWTVITVVSLAALYIVAPSGLLLLGFLGIIITTHEAGHFWAARRSGMKPTEFFWGFGPEIFAFERNGCRYGLKTLSLGGYVKIEGMTPTSDLPEGFKEADTYRAATHTGRIATILAGPAVNLLLSWVAFSVVSFSRGATPLAAVGKGLSSTWSVIAMTGQALWLWAGNIGGYVEALVGSSEPAVRFMSPVAQADVTMAAVQGGWADSFVWFAILSCAVGAINLVPLPPLDGSHALVAFIELFGQRFAKGGTLFKVNIKKFAPLGYATLFILVFLSASALVFDIRALTAG